MKAKHLIFLAAMLFALGCGDDWNPVAPSSPLVDNGGGGGMECNERLYPGGQLPPHCESPAEEQQ